ncbi:MAG: cob(I)yrinic acid a,c-diamide adenosyltransferase [Patescibacteria group bacterium]
MFYTGRGDNGRTSVFNCKKFSKSSLRIEALGALDELNSFLGVCKTRSKNVEHSVFNILEKVQNDLFVIQAEIGGTKKRLDKFRITELERAINDFGKELPKIKKFTLSGGTEFSALLDYARAVARRVERRVVGLGPKKVNLESLKYLNRLSSLLYVLARQANNNRGIKEKKPRY